MRSTLTTADVETVRNQTAGRARRARPRMNGDITAAIRSGFVRAMRLGTSSPITSDRYVIASTTSARPTDSPCGAIHATVLKCAPSSSASVAPPNTPARIPTMVIPICTVERKSFGRSASSRATVAPRSPSSLRVRRRALRDEMTAISAIAKTPFATMSRKIRTISRVIRVDIGLLDAAEPAVDAGHDRRVSDSRVISAGGSSAPRRR